ncbi:hypothetical protein ACWC4A_30390, partial [Streptomyces mirabilis]
MPAQFPAPLQAGLRPASPACPWSFGRRPVGAGCPVLALPPSPLSRELASVHRRIRLGLPLDTR